ncbi:hypothetical protein EXIGLDRAFT_730616 [Exidia glandulosa HHB12029]|uniref:Wax synthase domain-containing protein n=1 Tax=Exidia glandulosa HHB12029 TaxID=1314781 RepID=A0A165ZDQ4_EXIGL|nr:hypothetical protein EXIGLDRAFT_730616 [Exidia glandulosa HHB12029]
MAPSLEELGAFMRRWIAPSPDDKTPITLGNVWVLVIPLAATLVMAYLARRPNTWAIRIGVAPAVIMTVGRVLFGYYIDSPLAATFNYALGLCGVFCVGLTLELARAPAGRRKLGEKVANQGSQSTIERDADLRRDHARRPFHAGLFDAIELLCTMRGIEWDFGSGVHVPPSHKPAARGPCIRATLQSIVLSYFALDLVDSFVKLWPDRHTIFISTLPRLQRYALSSALQLATGLLLVAGSTTIYNCLALGDVVLLGHEPSSWPPAWDAPWRATSLNDLWARGWHQFLRRTFLFFGGYPLGYLFGRVGFVLGTFAASGVFHTLGAYFIGAGLDMRPFVFFAGQGVLVLCEHAFRIVTGRRVGGWAGRIWAYVVIFTLGQPFIDSLFNIGLDRSLVIHPSLSPARRILFPLIVRGLDVYYARKI